MTFAQIRGNEDLCLKLAKMIDSRQVPHAILFHEEDGGGAFPLCLAFLQYLYGDEAAASRIGRLIHPDVHLIVPTAAGQLSEHYLPELRSLVADKPYFTEAELGSALKIEGRNLLITVAESKRLLEKLSLTALEGGYRSVIMYLPEKMNADAANKLLKMIEEPPALTQFLLITHRPEKVLQTISSRCQRIRVMPPQELSAKLPEFEYSELFEDLMDALVGKDLLGALELAEKMAALPSREVAQAFCVYAAANMRLLFLRQQGIGSADGRIDLWAERLAKSFPRKALAALDRAMMLIGRNINLKILFTDLVNRLYMMTVKI